MNKRNMKKALRNKTLCTVQHNGWTCGTCFLAMDDSLTNQDWQALLLYRGDYQKSELDNLPEDIDASLNKIYSIASS